MRSVSQTCSKLRLKMKYGGEGLREEGGCRDQLASVRPPDVILNMSVSSAFHIKSTLIGPVGEQQSKVDIS